MVPKTKIPLVHNEFIGHDGKHYLDVAVDSTGRSTVTWLRKRLEDGKYFLVVGIVGGHFFKKELNRVDARELYRNLPTKLPFRDAFPKKNKKPDQQIQEAKN